MSKSNAEKARIGLAGEFSVAAELCKRGINASITLGNTKAVDIIIANDDYTKVKRVEVKSTLSNRVTTGYFQKYFGHGNQHPDFWVLVFIDKSHQPQYYIFTHEDLGKLQMEVNKMNEWPMEKHSGCDGISKSILNRMGSSSCNRWDIIIDQIAY